MPGLSTRMRLPPKPKAQLRLRAQPLRAQVGARIRWLAMIKQGLSSRLVTAVTMGVLAIALLAAAFLLPTPYVIFRPGPATNVLGSIDGKPLITITGAKAYPAAGPGTLDMTTIEVQGGPGSSVSLITAIRSWLSPQESVVPREQVYPPDQTADQAKAETTKEMTTSQQDASSAGVQEAGLPGTELIRIESVNAGVPAAAVLKAGDAILAIQGKSVVGGEAIRDALKAVAVGTPVRISVRRAGAQVELTTKTTKLPDGRTGLGVQLHCSYEAKNVKVQYASQDVGGPSAGLMFSLGVYDRLTPGELTGGKSIAGTGTITGCGVVGPIGGIAQKMVGARAAGAKWFLAPADNCGEVLGHIPDGLTVVKVSSTHQARLAVEAIAAGKATGLPGC